MTSPSDCQASVLSSPDEAAFVLEKGQSSIRTVRTFSTPRSRAHDGCFAPLLWRSADGRSHWSGPPPLIVRVDRLAGADHPAGWSSLQPVTAPAVTIGPNMRRNGALEWPVALVCAATRSCSIRSCGWSRSPSWVVVAPAAHRVRGYDQFEHAPPMALLTLPRPRRGWPAAHAKGHSRTAGAGRERGSIQRIDPE